ncbi:MAG: hypothetical protein EOP82_29320 [Variovorax sp.]|nr:MAG: hypothetical protein EOP82_29320 [Variovorax sp.]
MMEPSPIIRFHVDHEIAERAHQMARAQGMELPDALRMMLTRAVRNRKFSIDLADNHQTPKEHEHLDPFERRYWAPLKDALDAELAIALLHQAIADASARWDEARRTGSEKAQEQASQERQEALRLLANYDVSNKDATEDVLKGLGGTQGSARAPLSPTKSSTGSTKRRTLAEQDRFMAQCFIPDLFACASPSARPAAMVVLGQPGAGVSVAAALLGREMCRSTGPAVALSIERIRTYEAGLSPASAQRWLGRAVEAARQRRLHLILEDELQDPPRIHRFINRLRQDGYVVQVVFVCVSPMESHLALAARYALWRQHRWAPEFVTATQHEEAVADLRTTLDDFEKRGNVDGLRVIARDGRQLFENRLAGGDWLRPPRACAVLDKEQSRALPDKDAVQLAMRWETLSRALVHDPAVPREVVSQIRDGRRDAVERCEASESCARMLQWTREGAAFREMDRFAFEAAFPHHARAAALMGEAVIEAERHDAAEAERFLRSARENIAQRIERGDMARIAARSPAPPQSPKTRQ